MAEQEYPRVLVPPKQSFFLFGMRGVGKSTWARQIFPHAYRIDLLDEGVYQNILPNPSLFRLELESSSAGSWVIVDEIQRIPNLLNYVHLLIEEKKLRFVLLGSSARKLKHAGVNLLAGRALRKLMFPLLPEELANDFDLERVLTTGSLPLVWQSESQSETLDAYVQLYLKEEIKAEALVRNLPAFSRFLPVAAIAHGQVINISSLARDAGAARNTVEGYIEILEDTLLATRLPAFEARLRVRERTHPKLYWVDCGLVRAVKKYRGAVTQEERGPLLEGWIFSLLRTYQEIWPVYDEISYWSPAEARLTEVDFLLQRGKSFIAIEVKATTRFSPSMLVGLKAISALKGIKRRILVYEGTRQLSTPDGIEVLPIRSFAKLLEEKTL
jgi:uncharacterized protein